jgi:hypothetical protein
LLLKQVGGSGVDLRSRVNAVPGGQKTDLLVTGVDPSLDIQAVYDDRALQYLAMGTLLRAIKRGWLTQLADAGQHPYYAFRYLLDAYRSAANGSIPQLQQAPIYVWEVCYGLKPKTERFKTGTINYTTFDLDSLSEGDPAVIYELGPTDEMFHLYWGLTSGGTPDVNGFSILLGPPASYTQAFGEKAIKCVWQAFDNTGLNKLVGDPGTDAFLCDDTSAMVASYSEFGQSYAAPGGCAVSLSSERFITCPIMSKFVTYQEQDFGWRGWHEYRKSAGSATYIGPRSSEFQVVKDFANKVSPMFMVYNFDEYVEQMALWIGRINEMFGLNSTVGADNYPLTSQQFQILLRQAILPFFDNDMAQDLRLSQASTDDALVTMLPLSVGPNGVSITSRGESVKFPRFFVESLRCVRRLQGKIDSSFSVTGVVDLVPVLCRPGAIPQLGQYVWTAANGDQVPVFKVLESEVPIDLIECSATVASDLVFVDLNGPELSNYIREHNKWVESVSNCCTSLLDVSSVEKGTSILNLNTVTSHLNYIFTLSETVSSTPTPQAKDSKDKKVVPRPAVPMHRGKYGIKRPKKIPENSKVMERKGSKSRLPAHSGNKPLKAKIGAMPDVGSDYMMNNVGVVKVSSMYPLYSPFWKYQSNMIKPVFFVVAQAFQGSSRQYQTIQIQPYTLPICGINPLGAVESEQLSMPSLYDQHLNAANMDVKPALSPQLSEMEIDFNKLQETGHGGFFQSIGEIVGGWLDGKLF